MDLDYADDVVLLTESWLVIVPKVMRMEQVKQVHERVKYRLSDEMGQMSEWKLCSSGGNTCKRWKSSCTPVAW